MKCAVYLASRNYSQNTLNVADRNIDTYIVCPKRIYENCQDSLVHIYYNYIVNSN